MAINNLDVVRISPIWQNAQSGQVVNTFTVRVEGLAAPLDYADFFGCVNDWLDALYSDTNVTGFMSSANEHNRTEMYNITQGAPIPPLGAHASLDGEDSDTQLPTGVAALIVGRTAISRRVGRKFLPPFVEAAWLGSGWSATAIAAMIAFGSAWEAETSVCGGDATFRGVVGGTPPGSYADIIHTSVAVVPAYQRRRKRGRGA